MSLFEHVKTVCSSHWQYFKLPNCLKFYVQLRNHDNILLRGYLDLSCTHTTQLNKLKKTTKKRNEHQYLFLPYLSHT